MFLDNIGRAFSFVIPKKLVSLFSSLWRHLFSGFVSRRFKHFGSETTLFPSCFLEGERFIELGDNVCIGRRTILTAYQTKNYTPEIKIGNSTAIGGNCHITAINRIEIGSNVVLGEDVTITDNAHGNMTRSELSMHPFQRTLVSKGPVLVGDNVWIGDKVTILPNVKIGSGVVIGANSVVTKDAPPHSILVGNPAKVIKFIETN